MVRLSGTCGQDCVVENDGSPYYKCGHVLPVVKVKDELSSMKLKKMALTSKIILEFL